MEKGLFGLVGLSLIMGAIGVLLYYVSLLSTILAMGILASSIVGFIILCRKENKK